MSKAKDSFPKDQPSWWFVEAVPYTIEALRLFQNQFRSPQVMALVGKAIKDLEMHEQSALDFVRAACERSEARRKGVLN